MHFVTLSHRCRLPKKNLMSLSKSLLLSLTVGLAVACNFNPKKAETSTLHIVFQEEEEQFTQLEKERIYEYLMDSEKEVRSLLPNLPDSIQVQLEIVDWNLESVGGVTGRAESNSPPLVLIQISNTHANGVLGAIKTGLKSTVYHEFHHLVRGWAIQDNKFGPGIAIAMVNEGLAEVFAEQYTGQEFEANHIPEHVNADDWVEELLALPRDASYREWMFEHPDGRTSVGYRTGNHVIKKAMEQSNRTILELTNLAPNEIIKLAGY